MKRIFIAAILLVSASLLWAAEGFSFQADSMDGSMTKGRERVILKGRARVISDGMTIHADSMELYGEDYRYIECKGAVSLSDTENGISLTTDSLFYDRVDKIARLKGPSVMEDSKNGTIIKGDFIEHDDKRQTVIIQINVRIIKDDIICRAEFARYDRNANSLDLSGAPWVRKGSDEYRATSIHVNLNNDDIVLFGSVSGTVSGESKAEKEPAE